MKTLLFAGAAACALSAGAHAAFISFASDTNPTGPTVLGAYNDLTGETAVTNAGPVEVNLLADPDGDGPMGPASATANFQLDLAGALAGQTDLSGGGTLYAFSVDGSFTFTMDDGSISANVSDAVLTVLAFSGTGVSASIAGGDVTYSLDMDPFFAALLGMGNMDNFAGDFGLTLTSLNDGDGIQIITNERGEAVGLGEFAAEASFSGSFVIPTAGSGTLIGLAGLVATRRSRRFSA